MISFRQLRSTILALSLGCSPLMSAPLKLTELESRHGSFKGKMELGVQTVLLFESARVIVNRETGIVEQEALPSFSTDSQPVKRSDESILGTLKRKIARLPVHEQVRYWKLHQIRFPQSDVSRELDAALDRMEEIRQQTLMARVEETEVSEPSRPDIRRTRTSFLPYFPSFGYQSNYVYRRALRKDTQIELDRILRKPEPVENWTTVMSLADRARSDALSLVSGARTESVGRVPGVR